MRLSYVQAYARVSHVHTLPHPPCVWVRVCVRVRACVRAHVCV
jgi:hypothetical protein